MPSRLWRWASIGLLAAVLVAPRLATVARADGEAADLLRLADLADALFDAQAPWPAEASRLPELPTLVEHVAAQIREEGLGSGHIPAAVAIDGDFGPLRSLESGRYYVSTDSIVLNRRFLSDPSWSDSPWLGTLVHEMLHAEGYTKEAQVQLLTMEILASLANDGYPGAMHEVTDRLRRHALLSAWWLIAYGHDGLPATVRPVDLFAYCRLRCPATSDDVGPVEEARRRIFDPVELRRVYARERFWLSDSGRDYDLVLRGYVASTLGALLEGSCREVPVGRLARRGAPPPLKPRLDDTAAILAEIGWCQPG